MTEEAADKVYLAVAAVAAIPILALMVAPVRDRVVVAAVAAIANLGVEDALRE